jgi:hypothetical protein
VSDSTGKINYPEVFFGFVAPIGADLRTTLDAFKAYLVSQSYQVIEIKVTDVFESLARYVTPKRRLSKATELARYVSYIAYGNQLRAAFGDDILAASGIGRIIGSRLKHSTPDEKFQRIAYLVHQFKRKEEIELLRSVYGRLFFQVSVYSRRGARVDYLSRRFASSHNRPSAHAYRNAAETLVSQDENEIGLHPVPQTPS